MVSLRVYTDQPTDSGGGCGSCEANGGGKSRCGNGLEKVYNTTAVRFGYMKHVGEFTYADGMKFTCGARVVVQTGRGIEMGELVSLSCTGCDKHVSRDRLKSYIEASGADTYELQSGRVLREATVDDLREEARLRARTAQMKRFAQSRADSLKLGMKVVECEYLLGGDRMIFYFMADGRVDFRALVKDLSQEYQTRVKMHQVGARDEARLVADYETCGRQVCCKAFLKTLKPVTMRMAKLQRSTLDPTKVSGRCGRLKCCLRYEHESYESLDKKLPKVGEKVETAHGFGTVVNRQVLTQLIQIMPVGQTTPVAVAIEDVVKRGLKSFPTDTERAAETPVSQTDRAEARRSQTESRRSSRRRPRSGQRSDQNATPDDKPAQQDERQPGPSGEAEPPTRKPQRRRRGRRRRRRPGDGGGNRPPSSGRS